MSSKAARARCTAVSIRHKRETMRSPVLSKRSVDPKREVSIGARAGASAPLRVVARAVADGVRARRARTPGLFDNDRGFGVSMFPQASINNPTDSVDRGIVPPAATLPLE